jgi:glyoxylase-like metal-dependent hydrolase (beta-lactamase superfamily II)
VHVVASRHPRWLSNAYLVFDRPGGTAVFIDSGAPLQPLVEAVERERLEVGHLLVTHGHQDHVAGNEELRRRFGLAVIRGDLEVGTLRIEALATPGHSPDSLSFLVNGEALFSGDTLFRGSVGGGDFASLRRSVMEVLMRLPPATVVYPGHAEATSIGREWEENPFVRVWRGVAGEGSERCRVDGREATLIVWSPDYDGKGKAWVRFADGRDAIVGGSRVERGDGR